MNIRNEDTPESKAMWDKVDGVASLVPEWAKERMIMQEVDAVIEFAKETIEGFNKAFPCRENSMVVTKLDEALMWSE